jgi:hypothetical protein
MICRIDGVFRSLYDVNLCLHVVYSRAAMILRDALQG